MKRTMYNYEIETNKGTIDIDATNRTQAASKAKKQGYEVYSINMVGHYNY